MQSWLFEISDSAKEITGHSLDGMAWIFLDEGYGMTLPVALDVTPPENSSEIIYQRPGDGTAMRFRFDDMTECWLIISDYHSVDVGPRRVPSMHGVRERYYAPLTVKVSHGRSR